jgi:hypothetical protein
VPQKYQRYQEIQRRPRNDYNDIADHAQNGQVQPFEGSRWDDRQNGSSSQPLDTDDLRIYGRARPLFNVITGRVYQQADVEPYDTIGYVGTRPDYKEYRGAKEVEETYDRRHNSGEDHAVHLRRARSTLTIQQAADLPVVSPSLVELHGEDVGRLGYRKRRISGVLAWR